MESPPKVFWTSFAVAGAALVVVAILRFPENEQGIQFLVMCALAVAVAALPWVSSVRIKGLLEIERSLEAVRTETREQVGTTERELRGSLADARTEFAGRLDALQVQVNQNVMAQSTAVRSTQVIRIGSEEVMEALHPRRAHRGVTPTAADVLDTEIRTLSPSAGFPSAAPSLLEQFSRGQAIDYALINLGGGHRWLTSRIFLVAVLMQRMCALKRIVFVRREGGVDRAFAGMIAPWSARWRLAQRYPWLETAFARAYADSVDPLGADVPWIVSLEGALEGIRAESVMQAFLSSPAIHRDVDPGDDRSWTRLEREDSPPYWERGVWLDAQQLDRDFGDLLERDASLVDDPDLTRAERVRALLRRPGPFVARLDGERRFKDLVDRGALLEELAQRAGEPQAPEGRGSG